MKLLRLLMVMVTALSLTVSESVLEQFKVRASALGFDTKSLIYVEQD